MTYIVLNTLFTANLGPWFSTEYREMYLMEGSAAAWRWEVKPPYDPDRMLRVGKAMMHEYLNSMHMTLVYAIGLSYVGRTEVQWFQFEMDRDATEKFAWDTKTKQVTPKLLGIERFEFLVPATTTALLTEAAAMMRFAEICRDKPEIQRFRAKLT